MATPSSASIPAQSLCLEPFEQDEDHRMLVLRSSMGAVTVLVCTAAIVLVLVLRLYRSVLYRLATYQVLSCLLYAIVYVLEIVFEYSIEEGKTQVCQAALFVNQCMLWMQLMFTMWVTVHLFFFAVFYMNLKKWEIVYVVSSVLVSIAISVIPFITGSYGKSCASCWLQNWKDCDNCTNNSSMLGLIEKFATWYCPSFVVLVMNGVAIVVIAIVLLKRTYKKHLKGSWQRHKEALSQMLPFLVYPILWIALLFVPFSLTVRTILSDDTSTVDYPLLATTTVLALLMRLISGATLLLHICVMKRCKQRMRQYSYVNSEVATANGENTSDTRTFFEPRKENEIGDIS